MGVLKRFSYDNIVIHDPTAPDPVDYEGGGEGGGNFIIHGTPDGSAEEPTLVVDKSYDDIITAFSAGSMPVLVVGFGSNNSIYYVSEISDRSIIFAYFPTFTTDSTWVDVSASEIVIDPQNAVHVNNISFRISKVVQ